VLEQATEDDMVNEYVNIDDEMQAVTCYWTCSV
jgi:hypothetical protein